MLFVYLHESIVAGQPGFFQDLVLDLTFVDLRHQTVGVVLGTFFGHVFGAHHLWEFLVLLSGLSHHLVVVEKPPLTRLLGDVGGHCHGSSAVSQVWSITQIYCVHFFQSRINCKQSRVTKTYKFS